MLLERKCAFLFATEHLSVGVNDVESPLVASVEGFVVPPDHEHALTLER
jgi:hypothetical protein